MKNRASILIFLFVGIQFIAKSANAQTYKDTEDDQTFYGTLKLIHETDMVWGNKKSSAYLYFDEPIAMEGFEDDDGRSKLVKCVTLIYQDNINPMNIEKFFGKRVQIVGQLFDPMTGHYNTDLAIDMKECNLLKISRVLNLEIGETLEPSYTEFEMISKSAETGVFTYRYNRSLTESLFGRQIADVLVGVKKGIIVMLVYNLIPFAGDVGTPLNIVDQIQYPLKFPLSLYKGIYGVNIDDKSISISRVNNSITGHKDRIMYMVSVKHSILAN